MWLLYSSFLMFSGCGPKKLDLPCWVTSPCGAYTEKNYIIGVANAEEQAIADNNARAEIAKRFQVQISQLQSSEKESAAFSTEDGVNVRSRQALQTSTVAAVAMELKGVEIVARHKDEAGILFHSLAVLERAPLLAQLDERLAFLDKESKGLIVKAREAVSKLEKASAYHQAVPLLNEMELLNQRRVVVHPQRVSWDFFASSLQVQREEDDTMRTIFVQLAADPSSKDILPTLIEDLTLQGFTVVQGDPDLFLQVEGSEVMLPPDTFGFSQTRLSYHLTITEPKNENRIVLERALVGEAASQDLFKARQFALKNIQNDLSSDTVSAHLKKVILGDNL